MTCNIIWVIVKVTLKFGQSTFIDNLPNNTKYNQFSSLLKTTL